MRDRMKNSPSRKRQEWWAILRGRRDLGTACSGRVRCACGMDSESRRDGQSQEAQVSLTGRMPNTLALPLPILANGR